MRVTSDRRTRGAYTHPDVKLCDTIVVLSQVVQEGPSVGIQELSQVTYKHTRMSCSVLVRDYIQCIPATNDSDAGPGMLSIGDLNRTWRKYFHRKYVEKHMSAAWMAWGAVIMLLWKGSVSDRSWL